MNNIDLHTTPFVLLDDSQVSHVAGNSYLFHNPEYIIQAKSFEDIPRALTAIDEAVEAGFYTAGWISYEVGYYFEKRLHHLLSRSAEEPLIWMMVTTHREALTPNQVETLLHTSRRGNKKTFSTKFKKPDLAEAEYNKAIANIHEFIEAGDVYQINFTFPLPVEIKGCRLELYNELRKNQPVSFGAYINTGETEVLSFSPELFLERKDNQLKSKPMKGTAARGKDIEEDALIEQFLVNDDKSRAENLMIVDLIRNDLSRIAKPGSVQVPKLFETEKYNTLFQMTSTVTAAAIKDLTPTQALAAMFPCGSVTGAPKVRAMEIIAELEPQARGVYCGTIGYFHSKNWSLNVPIRTLVRNDNLKGRLSVGSGIVADSNPKGEYQECLLKARFTERTVNEFALIESLLVEENECKNLDLHMKRMKSSADYFNFTFPKSEIENALRDHASILSKKHKLRLLLNKTGTYSITSDQLSEPIQRHGKIKLSQKRTDSTDVFLRHKTTNRSLYNEEFKHAVAEGYQDILFVNQHGFITEGAISNIFAEIDGNLYTPPLSDGVLPGIHRASMLENNLAIVRSLTLSDLQKAEALYIGNAIRGLRKITISDL
ncbi:aminodeoxychorismate synthase component I [Kordiimonas laminariae]|uniref:aminodeoxychorismate synthase component I n=1 Tax=Kordiimonas laminariae TaxID=2917717 RepID=UPI001FF3CBA8|nr:aminodeoxychorismate synthase component I [Kordiimonas laminariae]MCK0069116.1 aminodeoxychorismate synthase component I [Kordiimonas laminariae]